MANEDNEVLQDCEIKWRNFEGREQQYNREGDRNFTVVLTPEKAKELKKKGWNVKTKTRGEEGDEDHTLQVAVSFPRYKDGSPNLVRAPKIVLVTSKGRTDLDEETVDALDWMDIEKVDLIIRPHDWAHSGRTGRKAYLKTIVVIIAEDPILQKYEHLAQLRYTARPELLEGRETLALPSGSNREAEEEEEIVDVEIVSG